MTGDYVRKRKIEKNDDSLSQSEKDARQGGYDGGGGVDVTSTNSGNTQSPTDEMDSAAATPGDNRHGTCGRTM